jgi:serine/threonine protein kinase
VNCFKCDTALGADVKFCEGCGQPQSDQAARSNPEQDMLLGRTVAGRYRIIEKIGEGGMGTVFRADQLSLKRTVALKVLKPEVSDNASALRRFNAEAEMVAKLNHPNTVGIYDFGQDNDGSLFIAMEYIEGLSLRTVLRNQGVLEPARAVHIAVQIAASLADAHQNGIVHRDLKPDNVMMQSRGKAHDVVRVLDFGIAKLRDNDGQAMTAVGDLLGTPQYMAPEQIRGNTLDGRTDVYALAAILYEMVTGRLVFESENVAGYLSMHLMDTPIAPSQRRPDLGLATELDRLVLAGLAKQPERRLASMDLMIERLTALDCAMPARHPSCSDLPQPVLATDVPSKGHSTEVRTKNFDRSTVPLLESIAPRTQILSASVVAAATTPLPAHATTAAMVRQTATPPSSNLLDDDDAGRTTAYLTPAHLEFAEDAGSAAMSIQKKSRRTALAVLGVASFAVIGGGSWYALHQSSSAISSLAPIASTTDARTVALAIAGDARAADGPTASRAPTLGIGLAGDIFTGVGFQLLVPPGFDNGEPAVYGDQVTYSWYSKDKLIFIVVQPSTSDDNQADLVPRLKKFAEDWSFEYVNHGTKHIADEDRLQVEFTSSTKLDSVGKGGRADGVIYETPTHRVAVFLVYPPAQLARIVQFRDELFTSRVTW